MIEIKLQSIGKKFHGQWVFRGIDLELSGNDKLAVTGYNGSGKSTFLQLLAGFTSPSEGSVTFFSSQKNIPVNEWYKNISCGAPYIDLYDELNLQENFNFYSSFKKLQKNISFSDFNDIIQLPKAESKAVRHFSSGMRQRLRLGFAILSDAPVLLLDEPLSNLDNNGFKWYQEMISNYSSQKLIVVCSNLQERETAFCNRSIDINNFRSI